jgi:hypothetical protein
MSSPSEISFGIHKVKQEGLKAHFKNPLALDGTALKLDTPAQWAALVESRFTNLKPNSDHGGGEAKIICGPHYRSLYDFETPADSDSDEDTPSQAGSVDDAPPPKRARQIAVSASLCGPFTLSLFNSVTAGGKKYVCDRSHCPFTHVASKDDLTPEGIQQLLSKTRLSAACKKTLSEFAAACR